MASSPPSPPPLVLDLAGAPAAVSCLRYADRVFLSVTSPGAGGFGTLVAAAVTPHPDGALETHVRVLLGDRDDALAEVAARRLQSAVHRDVEVPLLLALGVRDLTEERLLQLLHQLEELRPWR